MSPTLVATDLDRTLIYSRNAAGAEQPQLTSVENYQGRQASFMTTRAYELLINLIAETTVVPVTTRTRAQLARVSLPLPSTGFAIAANGGILLVNGEPDLDWSAEVQRQLAGSLPLTELRDYLARRCLPQWTIALRDAEALFCYAVIERASMPADFLTEITAWASSQGWSTSLQGRKLYWVPRGLTKAAAVREVARRLGSDTILAAGDSLLDRDLLLASDLGITPRHGELFDQGWTAPHIQTTRSSGVVAGEEILEWLLGRHRSTAPAQAPAQAL